MAKWKNNKTVGIIAGIVFLVCLIIVIKVVMDMRPKKAPLLIDQIHAVEPGEQVYIPQN